MLRWSRALNLDDLDDLGVPELLQTPGRLNDGTLVDYAWGMGIRSHAGQRLHRHGGGWENLRATLTRAPAIDLSLVTLALADNTERRLTLTDSLLNLMIV